MRSSVGRRDGEVGEEAVSPGPGPRSWIPSRRPSASASHPDPASAALGEDGCPDDSPRPRRARSGSSAGNSIRRGGHASEYGARVTAISSAVRWPSPRSVGTSKRRTDDANEEGDRRGARPGRACPRWRGSRERRRRQRSVDRPGQRRPAAERRERERPGRRQGGLRWAARLRRPTAPTIKRMGPATTTPASTRGRGEDD